MTFSFQQNDDSTDDEQESLFSFQEDMSAPKPTDGRICVELTDDDLEHIRDLAAQRNKSYVNGETGRNRNLKDDSAGCHDVGLRAEYAISKLYEDAELDEEIYTDGDDGVDTHLALGGDEKSVDIKGNTYRVNNNPDSTDLWVEEDKKRKENIEAFVVVYVPEDAQYVEVLGWVNREEVFKASNKEKSPVASHYNYVIEGGNFNTMPEPTTKNGKWLQ